MPAKHVEAPQFLLSSQSAGGRRGQPQPSTSSGYPRQHPRPSGSGRTSANDRSDMLGHGKHTGHSNIPSHSTSKTLRPNPSPSASHTRSPSPHASHSTGVNKGVPRGPSRPSAPHTAHSSRGPSDHGNTRHPIHQGHPSHQGHYLGQHPGHQGHPSHSSHHQGQRPHQPSSHAPRPSSQRPPSAQPPHRSQQQQIQQQQQRSQAPRQQQSSSRQSQQPSPRQQQQQQQQQGRSSHGHRGTSPTPNMRIPVTQHGNMQRPESAYTIKTPTAAPMYAATHRLPPSAQGYSQSSSQPHPPSQSQPPKLTPQISEEIDSPPRSPNPNAANSIKDVLYHNEHSEVFRWKDETWYAVEGQCELEVRQTMNNRSCVAIRLQDTGELYLNAWILPTTVIHSISATDVSLTVFMGSNPENYLIHFEDPADATALSEVLQKTHYESVAMDEQNRNSFEPSSTLDRSDSLASITAPNGEEHQADPVPQTLEAAMQCKCKLFVQNEHSNWSSFGAVNMKISQQMPSKKMFIEIESEKGSKTTKLVSASVHSRNVERINTKRISFLLINEKESISIVYMVKVKEDQIGNSIYEYIKTKNAENGW